MYDKIYILSNFYNFFFYEKLENCLDFFSIYVDLLLTFLKFNEQILPHHFIFSLKTFFFLLMVFGIRGIIPRYRYDQVSRLNWKQLLLITTGSLIVTSNILVISL